MPEQDAAGLDLDELELEMSRHLSAWCGHCDLPVKRLIAEVRRLRRQIEAYQSAGSELDQLRDQARQNPDEWSFCRQCESAQRGNRHRVLACPACAEEYCDRQHHSCG